MPSGISRRSFLKTTSAVAATALTARSLAAAAGANSRLNLAVVGCGGIAREHHLPALLEIRERQRIGILAVCDVYETRAKEYQDAVKAGGAGEPKIVRDYHDVLAMKDVDYVLFATPEHWHAKNALDALDAGKHVYVEKPVTHTIAEALAVVAKVKLSGLKLQVGVQGMSDDTFASAHEAIVAGKIGPVIHAQIEYCRHHSGGEAPWRKGTDAKMPKPDDLDWERWLGPAPKRPWFAPRYFEWRNYRDYSGGISTDLFVHRLSRIIKACGLGMPKLVAGTGGIFLWPDGRELPDNFQLVAEYPPVENITPGMTVHILGTMANRYPYDHAIRGHKGTLLLSKTGWQIIEQGSGKVLETYEHTGGESIALHHTNLHAAIRDGANLNCPAELGLYGLGAVRMANLSWFQRRLLGWDAANNQVIPADQLPNPVPAGDEIS